MTIDHLIELLEGIRDRRMNGNAEVQLIVDSYIGNNGGICAVAQLVVPQGLGPDEIVFEGEEFEVE